MYAGSSIFKILIAIAWVASPLSMAHAAGQAANVVSECLQPEDPSCLGNGTSALPVDRVQTAAGEPDAMVAAVEEPERLPAAVPDETNTTIPASIAAPVEAGLALQDSDVVSASRPDASARSSDSDGAAALGIGLIILCLVGLAIYFAPTLIALIRGHSYTWVIFALNLCGGWTGLGWLAAMVWAVWPTEKALIDPVVGNVTGRGTRNAGDALGAAAFGRERGYAAERTRSGSSGSDGMSTLEQLGRLGALRANGVIDDAEFHAAKTALLART
ncbi:hypothetical protein FHT00_003057 [Sphingomonas insulae]|uniref:SHOCT domain-containing protein n=2 Tax=Sphingomonas insulae TaxID=424800 RepID=A0ABN1HZJ1_9SPHN|nr:superinfection immunity protein [Sphingomonas insulae]NIJ31078.1 hypothetical protein [Sphingomonas insulae]